MKKPKREQAKRLDLSKISHSPDGRLIAASFNVYLCEDCEAAHVDFLGHSGEVFASGCVPPELFDAMSEKFAEFAALDRKMTGTKPKMSA